MRGINVKVDEKSKVEDNVEAQKPEVVETKKEEKKPKKADDYKYIRKEKDGRMFLLKETSQELEQSQEIRQKIDNELSLLTLKEGNLDKDKEILKLKIELIERDCRDVKTAKMFKIEEKRKENIKHSEYMDKVKKEVGHQTFGLSEEDEIKLGNS